MGRPDHDPKPDVRKRSWSNRKIEKALLSRPGPMSSVESAAARLDGLRGLWRQRAAGAVGAISTHADHPIAVGGTGARLEGFDDGARLAFIRPHAGLVVDGDQLHAFRNLEIDIGRTVQRHAHEVLEDRRREAAAGRALAKPLRLVVAH